MLVGGGGAECVGGDVGAGGGADRRAVLRDLQLAHERVKALGGGIAIQSRMAYQGEYFTDRYGSVAAEQTPPIKKMLAMDVPVGGGSDATRVSSYNPWVSMYWLTSGKTVGGLQLYHDSKLDRATALQLYTKGSAWFSQEQHN